MNAVEIRNEILGWMRYLPETGYYTSQNQRYTLIGLMVYALKLGASVKEANQRRREVLAWLFRDYLGKENASALSSKELTDECWWALWMYAEPWLDVDTNQWKPKAGFDDAMCVCLAAMARWYQEMDALCGGDQ